MEPCLNPRCIRWDTSLFEFLKSASSAGFPCVECFIQQAVAFADSHSEAALIDLFQSFQVTLAQFSGILPAGPILDAPVLISSADYEAALEGLDRRLAIATRLGCSRAQIVLNPRSQLESQPARR